MAGFDDGKQVNVMVGQQLPNFKESMDNYYAQVKDIGTKIESAKNELADTLVKLNAARTALQAQYTARMADLDQQIVGLQAQIVDRQSVSSSLDKEITDKQAQRDAITLDFSNKQKELDAAWADYNKATADLQNGNAQLISDRTDVTAAQVSLRAAMDTFEEYKKKTTDEIAKSASDAQALIQTAVTQKADADAAISKAAVVSDLAIQAQTDLNTKLAVIQPLLDKAVAIQKQLDDATALNNATSVQAAQNQTDANQIAVARVALHNKEVELNSREQTIAAAEQKIGGV